MKNNVLLKIRIIIWWQDICEANERSRAGNLYTDSLDTFISGNLAIKKMRHIFNSEPTRPGPKKKSFPVLPISKSGSSSANPSPKSQVTSPASAFASASQNPSNVPSNYKSAICTYWQVEYQFSERSAMVCVLLNVDGWVNRNLLFLLAALTIQC